MHPITYDKVDILGKGSCGTILYRGTCNRQECAVKAIYNSGDNEHIEKEIKALTKCGKHDNIVAFYSFQLDKDADRALLALELCHASLDQFIKNKASMLSAQISKKEILYQTSSGLAYLHSIKILHMDIKPQNILLSANGGVAKIKISDFGLSKFLPDERNSQTLTSLVGTGRWSAPEILEYIDKHEEDGLNSTERVLIKMKPETDVFALGCVFYFVISNGGHPFGKTTFNINKNIRKGLPSFCKENLVPEYIKYIPLIRAMVSKISLRPSCICIMEQLRNLALDTCNENNINKILDTI